MAIRGYAIGPSLTSSFSVSFSGLTAPGGGTASAVSGDLAVIYCGTAFSATVPSGWTALYVGGGQIWNPLAASKILNSTDIAAGSVTVNASGTYGGALAIVVFVGNPGVIREADTNGFSSGDVDTVATTSAVVSTDGLLYFGGYRGGANGTGSNLISTNRGMPLSSSYQAVSGDNLCVASFADGGLTGVNNIGFSFEPNSPSYLDIIVVVENAGISPYPPSLSCGSPPSGSVGVPYSHAIVAANINGNQLWSITSGALPTGLSINSTTGVISGTPSATGSYSFQVTLGYGAWFPLHSPSFNLAVSCSITIGGNYFPLCWVIT